MSQKNVIVTGASRGIGKATALYFAKQGYNVIITALNSTSLIEEVKQEIEAYDVTCLSYIGDLGDAAFTESMFTNILNEVDTIDYLVNNAGISYFGLLTDMSASEWDRIVTTNLTSVFHCCQSVIPAMVHQKQGQIINISSIWGEVGASCEVAYSATKGGVNALTKALAKELAPSNIQVNAIACGAIDTTMNDHMTPEEKHDFSKDIPSGRFGSPEEVAQIVFQIATASNYLTGQIIRFDGGFI